MSCVLIIDDIPHIVRYGMHTDEPVGAEKCWIHFYRQGVCFVVHAEHGNVRGTRFAERWVPLLKTPERAPAPATGMRAWVKRWEDMCRLVITPCLGTLERLVAVAASAEAEPWKTLDGYLNTVRYELEIVSAMGDVAGESGESVEEADGMTARVVKGPEQKPSYEFWPCPAEEVEELKMLLPDLSADDRLALHHARDLEVLDAAKDWRAPPYKVRAKYGEVFYLVRCEKSARNVSTGTVSNRSLDRTNAHIKLHKVMSGSPDGSMVNVNIPRLRGVVLAGVGAAAVVPGSGSGNDDGDGDGQHVARPSVDDSGIASERPSAQHTGLGVGVLIAGVLLDYLPHARTLAEFLAQAPVQSENVAMVTATEGMKQRWKEQVSTALRYLHSLRITIGGHAMPGSGPEEDRMWYYVNSHTVMIVERGYDAGASSSTTQQGRSSSDVDAGSEPQRDAWLSLEAGCTFHGEENEHEGEDEDAFAQARSMDWKGVERTFNSF